MDACKADSRKFRAVIRNLSLQNLADEVKLVQNALQKYKLEFKSLDIQSQTLYKANAEQITPQMRYTCRLVIGRSIAATVLGTEACTTDEHVSDRCSYLTGALSS